MSAYKCKADFINRTKFIISEISSSQYSKTAFINCCLGLLVAPEQWTNGPQHEILEIVDYENWGIDSSLIICNRAVKGGDALSVENIAYHFRNCLCHFLFDVKGDNQLVFSKIHIEDYLPDSNTKTFQMTIDFNDFMKFVMKYVDEKMKLLCK